jgi:Flp pilus assembly protein TadG
MAARRRDEQGAVSVAVVIAFGAALLLFMLAVDAGLYWHMHHRADVAADRAATAAARIDGSSAAGHAAAQTFLAGAPLDNATVSVSRGSSEAVATVRATTPSLMPFISSWGLSASRSAPIERFIPEPERP